MNTLFTLLYLISPGYKSGIVLILYSVFLNVPIKKPPS